MFMLSQRSLVALKGVHPDLVRVVGRAIKISAVDFMVVEGVRSREGCMVNWGKGRTAAQCIAKGIPASYAKPALRKVTWLNDPFNSVHCLQKDGFGHAVDLLPAPYNWQLIDPKETPEIDDVFALVAKAMLKAAELEGVKLRWGANWDGDKMIREKGETDNPHFELVR